jgi:hypothetical protein
MLKLGYLQKFQGYPIIDIFQSYRNNSSDSTDSTSNSNSSGGGGSSSNTYVTG